MIDKRDVQAFFDRLAPDWDAGMVRNEAVIARILDNAGVCEGCTVLDVACGTGVLFPDYLARGASVTGIDISPEMARIAAATDGSTVDLACSDADFGELTIVAGRAAMQGGRFMQTIDVRYPTAVTGDEVHAKLEALAQGARLASK